MAPHSSILAWEIAWAEEPGGIQAMGLQRVMHDWATEYIHTVCLKVINVLVLDSPKDDQKAYWLSNVRFIWPTIVRIPPWWSFGSISKGSRFVKGSYNVWDLGSTGLRCVFQGR